ncbi:MAG: universal stress protein [Candidatus Acidiferrales bacterium]
MTVLEVQGLANMNDRVTLGNILFATDLSGQSAHAVGWLRWLCGRYHSTAYVLNVLDVPSIGLTAEDIAKRQIAAEERFSSFIRKHNLKQKPFTSVLATGDTAQVITEFVGNCSIALVLLGSRAVGLHRLLRGSISEEVVRSTDCPIITVGLRARPPRSFGIRRVLFATNLARQATSVLTRLQFLFRGNLGAELALAHFLPQESKSLVERHEIRKRLHAKLIEIVPLHLRGRVSDVVVEPSSPVNGILEFSKHRSVDLIVLAVRDAGPFTRAATHRPLSITHQVIRAATCPVLTIRM